MSTTNSQRDFILHKLHSLTGLIPVGVFLMEHFLANCSIFFGAEAYGKIVAFLESIPFLWVLEWGVIIIPLVFHGILGAYFVWKGKNNPVSYPYFRNIMFYLQRITGVILLLFISYHFYSVKIYHMQTGVEFYDIITSQMTNPLFFVFYFAGVISASFHFCNGLWGFLLNWGLLTGRKAQEIWGYIFFGLFIVFTGMWILIMLSFIGINIPAYFM